MTLDSYLRDLLGANANSSTVTIVNDNATAAAEHDAVRCKPKGMMRRMNRSSSWVPVPQKQNHMHQSSRWDGNTAPRRRKSDSALGKPTRRTSDTQEDMIHAINAVMLEEEAEELSRSHATGPTPLVRAFSERMVSRLNSQKGSKSSCCQNRSERRAIDETMKALDFIRSSNSSKSASPSTTTAAESYKKFSEQQPKRIFGYLESGVEPPYQPKRKGSLDMLSSFDDDDDDKVVETPLRLLRCQKRTYHKTTSPAKNQPKVGVDLPQSLRELPYDTTTTTT